MTKIIFGIAVIILALMALVVFAGLVYAMIRKDNDLLNEISKGGLYV